MMTSLFFFSFFLNRVRVDEKCCEQNTHMHEAAAQSHIFEKKSIYVYEEKKRKQQASPRKTK